MQLVSIAGHDVYIPVLQIYWYRTSPSPTTVIHLDSAVVLPEDDSNESKWNKSRFKVLHVKKAVDESSIQMTRSFTCKREGRDAWVHAISSALLEYEKGKAKARKPACSVPICPLRRRFQWSLETFPLITSHTSTKPTPSPLSRSASPPLPLVDSELGPPLLGEAFLDPDDE
jgi:hypothetical protein